MTHVIAEPCIGTKNVSCVEVCPVDCIHPTSDEAEFENAEMLYIDPDACIDCALCVDECPVNAIFIDDELIQGGEGGGGFGERIFVAKAEVCPVAGFVGEVLLALDRLLRAQGTRP